MGLWKIVGLAGIAGVAATGAIIARDQRQRAQLSPDEVRARLHERVRDSAARPTASADGPPSAPGSETASARR